MLINDFPLPKTYIPLIPLNIYTFYKDLKKYFSLLAHKIEQTKAPQKLLIKQPSSKFWSTAYATLCSSSFTKVPHVKFPLFLESLLFHSLNQPPLATGTYRSSPFEPQMPYFLVLFLLSLS